MKIVVYAISKNEEQFVDRFCKNAKEADAIYVLDTGSTDKTVEKLQKNNVHVIQKEIKPWRFDVARNESLNMIPEDVDLCVCLDLDEVIEEGWRKKVESIWKEGITRIRYNYIWSFDEYQNPAVNFYSDKIHTRKDYYWTHPVHEILTFKGTEEQYVTLEELTVKHYPDPTKSRSSYLELLELSVKEDPLDDRNMHYLGREYMFRQNYEKAIETLKKHLTLEKATWKDERCASMRFLGRCYQALGDDENAEKWFQKATEEAPYLREPFAEYANLKLKQKQYEEAEKLYKQALWIPKNTKNYINEPFCYDGTIEDNLSLCLYYSGQIEESFGYACKAFKAKPKDERIKNNIKIIFEQL